MVHSHWDELKLSYGYLWWIIDENEHSYAAIWATAGMQSMLTAAKNLVVAIASLFKPTAKDRIELIKKYIEPIFED